MPDEQQIPELHLRVFIDRSELVLPNGRTEVFYEGAPDDQARLRYQQIKSVFENGFLDDEIVLCRDHPESLLLDRVSEAHAKLIDRLVTSVTSEVGRGLTVLTVLQLCIKTIAPTQSIRLHKGGPSSRDFSWRDGISMRSLDNKYVTSSLRHHDLVKMNKDGGFMTRTLAENYPYSKLYKAYIRGARAEWTSLVDAIENGEVQPRAALQYLLSKLLNNAAQFKSLVDETIGVLNKLLVSKKLNTREDVTDILRRHMLDSNYAARIMEISMHALLQAMQDLGGLGSGTIVPLSQMRSANKKHGNIGDIEVMEAGVIVEAWDAKFGKGYLRDEMEELNDKLVLHEGIQVAGFVTSGTVERLDELDVRRREIEELHQVSVPVITLDAWIGRQFGRSINEQLFTENELAEAWIVAYVESLAQRRLSVAPIDEPCAHWLKLLRQLMQELE